MSPESVVETAGAWARWLVQRESRGPGDTENAMRRISRRYGVPYSILWSLRYRPPKDMLVSAFIRLEAAYEAEKLRQMKALEEEFAVSKHKTRFGAHLVRAAAALAGAENVSHEEESRDEVA